MKIGIIGAGAMGLLLCQRLQASGHAATLYDRPDRVAELLAAGVLTVVNQDGSHAMFVPGLLTSDFALAGPQDLVILATKAQDLPGIAPYIPQLTAGVSPVLGIQNGIPWWYLYGSTEPAAEGGLRCLDPHGQLQRYVQPAQIIGCVAYPAAMQEAGGRVRHVEGDAFPVGELDGSITTRANDIAALFQAAGFRSRVLSDIRSEIWLKLLGAVSINPVSALTRASMSEICSFPPTQALIRTLMQEAQDIAQALGITLRVGIEQRIEGARRVGGHKTSMLQDVENNRPLELDAVMLAVLELAELTGKPAPMIRSLYACASLLNQQLRDARSQAPA